MNIPAQNNIPEWENPEVFAVNKEKARTTSIPYASAKQALSDEYVRSPYYRSLSGMWKFYWVPKSENVPSGFYAENFKADDWPDMPVPGNWEFNGYGIPMYVNHGFGFRAKPPHINRDDSPTGAYRKDFIVPEAWKDRRVFLHFEGGTCAMYVWVNGKKAGYTENTKSPAEFDITDFVRPGKNLLACEVRKFSDGSYLEDQDMWRLGGINRNVYLYSTAQTRILDFFAKPDLDDKYRDGLFSVDITLKNYTNNRQDHQIEASLSDEKGKTLFTKKRTISISENGIFSCSFSEKISNPLKWTAETPHLYSLLITLKNENGDIIESTSHKTGFRKIELKDGKLLVNGKKIYFKGVNLHEFNTHTGQVVDSAVMLRNIQLMKELNINAVRTSHYPQPPLWYKLCDKYGIYLVDEANLESHGLGYGPENVSNFPEWHAAHMDRMIALVERDKNHPSVICWSLGNEASNGKAFFDMYDWTKNRDTSRLVQYEQAGRGRNTDVICPMYPSWEEMEAVSREAPDRPYIMCEYAHAMGNSMGSFQEYWDLIRSSENMQGGFIWEWYNQGFKTKDEQDREYWAYGGDLKGYNKMNLENFCMDGIVTPDQEYMPHTHIVKKVYQNILFDSFDWENGILTVSNDFKFTDLTSDNYSYKWQLLKNGTIINTGTFTVSVPADDKRNVKIALPKIKDEPGTEYFLHVFAYAKESSEFIPTGFEVAKEEFEYAGNNYFADTAKFDNPDRLHSEKKDDMIEIKYGALSFCFSVRDNNQSLVKVTNDGKDVFNRMPRPNFWRAPTDNDFGNWAQYNLRIWDVAGHNIVYRFKNMQQTEKGIEIEYEAKLKGIDAKVDITYVVKTDGKLSVRSAYRSLSDELPEMMRFGMMMVLPDDYEEITWYGRGPHENYPDRCDDAFMGIWNSNINDMSYPYFRPQETGNRTDVRRLVLKDNTGKGLEISGKQPLALNISRNYIEDLDPGMTKKQQHISDVLPREEIILHIDLFQRGVGGLNSWGAFPSDKYRYFGKEYSYEYVIEFF